MTAINNKNPLASFSRSKNGAKTWFTAAHTRVQNYLGKWCVVSAFMALVAHMNHPVHGLYCVEPSLPPPVMKFLYFCQYVFLYVDGISALTVPTSVPGTCESTWFPNFLKCQGKL